MTTATARATPIRVDDVRETEVMMRALGFTERVGVDMIRRQMEALGEPLDAVPDAVVAEAALRLVRLLVRDPSLGVAEREDDAFDFPDD